MKLGRIALATALALIAGCGTSPKERYYTLSAAEAPAGAGQAKAAYSVAVGPVTVPAVVDRFQIVLRVEANRVEVNDLHRWAEPLRRAIPRVVAANLARELGTARVVVYPPGGGEVADYRVFLDVIRFESEAGKAVTIEMAWSIRRGAGGELRTGSSVVRESVGAAGYDALVAAHSRALAAVSRDIAEALRSMSR
jgi:uncharacterized lipoprotein YmbA